MASKYDKYRESWAASSEEVQPEMPAESAAQSPGRAGKEQVVRGAVGMLGSVMDAGQYVGREMYAKKQAMARRMGFDAPSPAPTEGPSYRERFIDQTGIGEPNTFGGQVGEMVGGSIPMNVVTGGMGYPVNVIRDIASSTAAVYAGKNGYGRTGQMVASVLTAMAVPNRIPGMGSGGATSVTRPPAVTGQADDAVSAIASQGDSSVQTLPMKMLSDADTAAIAKKYGVKPDNIREVAKILQDRVIIDPVTGAPRIDDLVAEIDDTMRIFPNPAKRPTTAQVAGKLGGSNLLAMETTALLDDPILNSRAGGIRDAIETDLKERFDGLVGGGSTQGALEKSTTLDDSLRGVKAQAWANVPFDELPVRPARSLKSTLGGMKSNRSMLYRHVPSDLKDLIENLDESVTARDLQDMRARVGEVIADPDATNLAKESSRVIKDVIDFELDQLPEEGSKAYRSAVASTAKYHQVFPGDSSFVKALRTTKDRTQLANSILKAKDKAKEFEIAKGIFGQTEGGMEDLRAILMKTLVGENIGDIPMSTVKKSLSNEGVHGVYKSLLGPEDFSTFKDVLKGFETGTRYANGTPAAVIKTQSVIPAVQRLAAGITSPIKTLKNAPTAVQDAIESLNAEERKLLMNEMIFDLDLTRRLARIPTNGASEKVVSSWLADFGKLVARSVVRSQSGSQSAATPAIGGAPGRPLAAARAALGPMVVNQPLPDQDRGGVR